MDISMEKGLYAKSSRMFCCVPRCKKQFIEDRQMRSTFSFPKDKTRCAIWIDKCGCDQLKTIDPAMLNKKYRLCSKHFEDSMYANFQKNRLKSDAIPTLFDNREVSETSNIDININKLVLNVTGVSETKKTTDDDDVNYSAQARCSTPDFSIASASSSYSMSDASTSTNVNTSSTSVQTPKFLSDTTPRKVSLRKKLDQEIAQRKELEHKCNELNNKLAALNSLENSIEIVKPHVTPTLFLLLKSQIKNKDKAKHGRRFSNDLKQLALNIYFLGPRVYQLLQNSLSLPTPRTLRRITNKYELNPGLNDFLFNLLSFKINSFNTEALDCVLCADEMSLKTNLYYKVAKDKIVGFHEGISHKKYEPAKYALVLMIRGINHNWKQPIAYFLVSSTCTGFELKDIILTTISRLLSIKLNIKALITDQGSNFVSFSNSVYISPERPYFEMEGQKIIYIFDPPHLLKSTRNMFFKHNFEINNEVLTKDHIVSFYKHDSQSNIRLAPKLTNAHIYPGPFEKMRVYLAAQVFSSSVAAGMSVALTSSDGILPLSAQPTINFINDMDKLFDLFNSSRTPGLKEFKRPFKYTTTQIDHLNKMTDFFKNVKVIDKIKSSNVTNRMNFIKGWLISISGLQMLYHSLNPTQNINYVLYTNRINQDCLENLFCTFRQQQGNNCNPTPISFTWSFKKIVCLNYFKHSPNANCIEDFDQILNSDLPSNQNLSIVGPEKNLFNLKSIKIGTVDYRDLSIPERNSFVYVCGYLMKKCLEKHNCQVCIDYARCQKQLEQSFLLCYFKAYPNKDLSTFGNLMMPHNDFYNYVYELENIFIAKFPTIAVSDDVGAKLKFDFNFVPYNHPCPLFNKTFLINLFTRFRIFTACKFLNKSLMSEKKLKNRKLSILTHL